MRCCTVALIVGGLLAAVAAPLGAQEAVRARKLLLLSQGPDGHPAGTHEYASGLEIVARQLADYPQLTVRLVRADNPWSEGPDLLGGADGVVLFLSEGAKWVDGDAARRAAFQQLAARRGGLSVLHWAMGCREAQPIDTFVSLFGGCHGGPDRKYQVLTTTLSVAPHAATTGLSDFKIRDEFYYRLKLTRQPGLVPLLTARIDDRDETLAWAWQRPDGGRSFGFSGCHFHENWDRREYRRLVAQGIAWTLGLDAASP
jgi:hypothetical protein